MSQISEDEQLRRRQVNECVIGTHALSGIHVDAETFALMQRYEVGELTREQLSAELDCHAQTLLARLRQSANGGGSDPR